MNAYAAKGEVPLEQFHVLSGELFGIVGLVDDLGDADDVTFVIADRHAQDEIGPVAGPEIDPFVESGILKQNRSP